MIAPAGFLTREHAERVLAAGDTATAEILARFNARVAEVLVTAPDAATALALCEQASAAGLAELAALDALVLARIHSGTEH